jgi:hypothetical protein
MKANVAGLIAVPLLAISSYGFASEAVVEQESVSEPITLSMNEMDGVTAGSSINLNNTQLGLSINEVRQNATAASFAGDARAVNVSRIVNVNRFWYAPR